MKPKSDNHITDHLPWAVMTLSAQMKVLYANAAAKCALNQDGTNAADFLIGITWVDHRGAPLPAEEHPVAQCIKRRETLSGVVLGAVLPSGSENVWMEAHCIPEMEEGSQEIKTLCFTFRKITSPLNVNNTDFPNFDGIADSTAKRRFFESRILNGIGEAVVVFDLQGSIVYVNQTACDMYGWSREELLLKNAAELAAPGTSPELAKSIMKSLEKGKSWSGEFMVKRKDGALFPVRVTDLPFINENGNFTGVISTAIDISENRKQEAERENIHKQLLFANNELLKNANQLAAVFDSVHDALLVLDPEGKIIYANRAYNETFRRLVGEIENRTINDFIGEIEISDRDGKVLSPAEWPMLKVLAGRKLDKEVLRITHHQNQFTYYVQISGGPVYDADGKQLLSVLSVADVTQQETQNQLLLKGERSFQKLFFENPQPMWIYDLETLRFLEVNQAAVNYYGYSREEFMGMTIKDIRPKETVDKLLESVANTTEVLNHSGVWQHMKKNGELIDVEVTSHWRLYKGRQVRHILVNDITERNKALFELRNSEGRYRSLFENMTEGVIFQNADNRFTVANRAAQQLLGLTQAEIRNRVITDVRWKAVKEDGRPFAPEEYPGMVALRTGRPVKNIVMGVFHPGKQDYVWLLVNAVPEFKNGDTKPYQVFITFSHITDRKKAEDRLKYISGLSGLLAKISNIYINLSFENLHTEINRSLAAIGAYVGADRFYVFEYDWEHNTCSNTHEWCAEGITPQIADLQLVPLEEIPEWVETHRAGDDMLIPSVQQLPGSSRLRRMLEQQDIKSLVTVPIMDGTTCVGFVGFDAVKNYHPFSDAEQNLLNMFARMLLNVIKRHQTALELMESTRRVNMLMNNLKGAAFRCKPDDQWTMEFISQGIAELTGYSPGDFLNNRVRTYTSVIHPDDRERVQDMILERLKQHHQGYTLEYRLLTHSGEVKWVWEKGQGIYENQKLVAIEGYISDITERKRAEEKIRITEKFYRTIIEKAPDGICLVGPDGMLKYASPSALKMFHYPLDTKEFPLPDESTHPEDLPFVLEKLNHIIQHPDEVVTLQYRFKTYDNAYKWIESTFTNQYTAQGVEAVVINFRDIDERKQAEEALLSSEALLKETGRIAQIGGWELDCSTMQQVWTDETYVIHDREKGKYNPNSTEELSRFEPTSKELIDAAFEAAFTKGKPYDLEVEMTTVKGNRKWVRAVCSPVLKNGKVTSLKGMVQDITERKQAEEKVRESEKRFATIFEDSPIAIALSRITDGKIIMVNPSAIELFGFTHNEIIGHSTTELGLWENPEDRQHFVETLNSGKHVSGMEAVLRLKSGEKREVLIWGESIFINNEPCMMAQIVDISERKQAEKQLRDREAELMNAQELANMASWRFDFATGRQTVSENYRKLFGIDDTEEITFEYFLSRVHPDDAHLMNADNYTFVPDAPPFIYDFRFILNDGSVKWVQSSLVPEFNNDQLVALKGTNIDITDKKNRAEEIRLQNEKLSAILNSLPDKLFVHDSEGAFLEAYTTNPDGYILPADQFMGKKLSDGFPKEVAELNLKYLRECLAKKELITHEFSVDYKGVFSHFEVRVVPFMEDKVIRFVRDITQKKDDERQLENYRHRLEELVEQRTRELRVSQDKLLLTQQMTKLGSWEFHPEANKALWSEETYRIFERDPQKEAYTLDEFIASMVPKYREKAHRKILKSMQKKKSVELNTKHITEKGNTRYLKVNGQAVLKNGDVDYFIGSMLDVTQERLNQKRLNAAVKSAIAANRAKSEFLANMSHEIRTPLNSIIGFSELLYNSVTTDKKRSQVESIRNSGRTLLNIINDILDLSKVEAGKIVIEREPLDVFKIVCEVGGMFEQKAAEKNLGLTIEAMTDLLVPLMIDETRLRQILFNLVGNAIKFTEQGKIAIYIHHEEKENGKVDLQITIKDTGIGIPEDQQEAIFEPFVQQQGQLHKNYGGTGLGLSISRRMAEAMGGKISVQSSSGIGSAFTVLLKNVVKAEVQPGEKTDLPGVYSNIRLEGNTILVADDIADNRKLLLDVLELTGARLLEAENGAEAVQLAKRELPDIILMDLRMPVMNGLEAACMLKELPETEGIPCVAVSASIKLGSAKRAIPQHFDEYLMKPVAFGQLFDVLLRYLSHRKKKSKTGAGRSETPKDGEKEWSHELKRFATNELVPLYHHVMKTQLVDEMEDFGKQLVAAGTRFEDEMLIHMGNKLGEYADLFEVDKLTQTMHEFQFVLNRKLK